MKRFLPLLAVLLACLVCVPAALAQSRVQCDPGGGDASRFFAAGTVTAVDTTNDLLTFTVAHASDGLTGSLTVVITPDTQLFSRDQGDGPTCQRVGCERTAITLADVVVGERVRVCGTIDASSDPTVYTAERVCVCVPRFACVGAVTVVDTTNNLLTLTVAHGTDGLNGTLIVAITPGTRLFSPAAWASGTEATLADIAVGDEVAVCGAIDASSGTAVYDARIVFDCGSADALPAPVCAPESLSVRAGHAGRGDLLKVHLKVADAMPGCSTAKVALTLTTTNGRKLAAATASGVALNKTVAVSFKLPRSLIRGTYRIVARATDAAGNRQAHAKAAILKVK